MPSRTTDVGTAVPLIAIAVWQLLSSSGVLDYEYLPSPREVLSALVSLARTGELAADVAHTLGLALAASAITLTVGGALGLTIGLFATVRGYVMASIDFLRTIPAVCLVPVAVLMLGPAATTELTLAVYAALWPMLLTTAAGVAAVSPRQYDVARMLHLSRAATVRKIVVPAVLPAWLVGARLSAVITLLVAIVAEMVMYPRGLGGGLVESLNALAPARMWAYALLCGVIGYALNGTLRHAVRLVQPGDPAVAGGQVAVTAAPAAAQPVTPPHGLLPVVALLVVWQIAADGDSWSLPPPAVWLTALRRMGADGTLAPALTQTLTTFLLGLACAAVVGAAAGAMIGASRRMDRALTPAIDFLAAVPGAALVPVIVLVVGPTQLSGVLAVAVVAYWPILLNTAMAMRTVPAVRLEMSRTLGLAPLPRWTKVVIPSLVPGILLGTRVAAAIALIITLLVDIFGPGAGVGRLLLESQQRFDAAAAWGLLLIMGIFGYLASACLAWIARRATKVWQP